MLTLLTATGARPQAWALCQRWMARQTYAGPVRWVIVDDGPEAQPVTFVRDGWSLEVIRPAPAWVPGQNTQARNLLAGLAAIGDAERLVIVEDDDWYAADYLAHVADHLQADQLLGEPRARYYNVATRTARQLRNARHASLCATALHGAAVGLLRRICARRPRFIDLELWARAAVRRLVGEGRVVGIKGLPGRGGIGVGHSPDFSGTPDHAGQVLAQWVGADDSRAILHAR